MGAGKAGLSLTLLDSVVTAAAVSAVVLVDAESFKHKSDGLIRRSAAVAVARYRIDIRDLHLPALPSLSSCRLPPSRAVLIGKHVCGAALDLSINCALRALHAEASLVASLLIASCCHHRCTWATYAGRAWLERWRISEAEFALLCRMSSWGCNERLHDAVRRPRAGGEPCDREHDEAGWEESADWGQHNRLRMSADERVAVGRECKWMLDLGRMHALRDAGFDAQLSYFVHPTITRENVVLIARNTRELSAANPNVSGNRYE